MGTHYDPKHIEPRWYDYWMKRGFFRAERPSDAHDPSEATPKPHVIMMPPPNVTGRLHMGHALQDAVQDALTRLRRMQGYSSLWMPGLDHAGIATQNVVEKKLKEQGRSRKEMGREAFVEEVYEWKEEYGGIILDQKRKLGDSADWERTRFTMDEGFTRGVQTIFVKLYEDGLIYRGDYLVNWDPENMTAISDEEVENVERDGHLWFIKYPILGDAGEETGEHVTIATTRPETMLGDTAIAVHPEDERYQHLVGKKVKLPLVGRAIPVIADDYVKPEFGAGALKITPGHDKNDFEIGQRHDLEVLSVIEPDATIGEDGGAYAGLDRFEARKKIVADLDAAGLLEKTEPYRHAVPISSRSKTLIEPLISRQWFVSMKPLAEPALEAVRRGDITFYPERWQNEYFRWLENVRDWPISRQLWWGHRIPVWYYLDEGGEIDEARGYVVSVEQPEAGMVQDEDVLDTWFSSWLWPFATLGWPDVQGGEDGDERARDLAYFYPGDVLVSGYDILYFWIARMIMAGLYVTGTIPFRHVFITGMIKDKQGRWMSKSLGNGIDPLDMIEQYGADAVRFSLVVLCAQGQDIKLDPTKFEMGRNFANKIWNAFNVFAQHAEQDEDGAIVEDYRRTRAFEDLTLVERWMLTRLNQTIEAVEDDLSRYRLNEALLKIYALFWGDYCDWYLEGIKPQREEDGSYGTMERETVALSIWIYEKLIQLLHPFMPHITEALWWKLRPRLDGEACIVSAWPQQNTGEMDEDAADTFALVQEIATAIRAVKNSYGVSPGKGVSATVGVETEMLAARLQSAAPYFERYARVDDLTVSPSAEKPEASASAVVSAPAGTAEVFVPLAGMIDLDKERERLEKEIAQKEGFLSGVRKKLANENFVSRAPEAVVEKERQKLEDTTAELDRLRANLADLGAL
jgi:valyl-tRNA synthetase